MLPRVKIQFLNGQLGTVGESADGLLALIVGAAAVSTTFVLEKAYHIMSLADLTALGVTSTNNKTLYKTVKEFYDEAENGTELVVFGVDRTSKMSEVLDYNSTDDGSAKALITAENGALRGIVVAGLSGAGTNTEGLDSDVFTALPLAQQLAEKVTEDLYSPLFVCLEGAGFDSTKPLKDLSSEKYDRVCILIGDTVNESEGAAVGTIAGRIASIAVQRNIGRVRDGSLFPVEMFIGDKKVDQSESLISQIYEKGYITPRKYVGRSGYFFVDDKMACDGTDDYAHLTARRVIDKAYRIAYDTLLDMMLDELEVNEDGTLQNAVVASWQQTVEDAINSSMTANGELSATDGEGCVCFIDPKQNVVSTSTIKVTIKVRPYGYARYVDVNLGFQVTSA